MMSRRMAGWVFMAALALLAALNVVAVVRIQLGTECAHHRSLCLRPRDILKVARAGPGVIGGQFAIYHFLRRRIAGATLIIPPWFGPHQWLLHDVARLNVKVSDTPLIVPRGKIKSLQRQSRVRTRWLSDEGPPPRLWRDLFMDLKRGAAAEYVLAETGGRHGKLFLIPSKTYEIVARSADKPMGGT